MTTMKQSFQFSGLEIARCYNLRHSLNIKTNPLRNCQWLILILPECVFSIPVKFEFFFSRAPIKTFF